MRRLFLAVTIGAVLFTSCAKEKAPPIPVQNLESVNSKTSEEQNEHSLGIVVSEELPGGSRAELGSQVTAMLVYQYRICLDNPVNCIRASFASRLARGEPIPMSPSLRLIKSLTADSAVSISTGS